MRSATYIVRPTSLWIPADTGTGAYFPDFSDFYDISDAVEVHCTTQIVTLSGTEPVLTVTPQTSIDGVSWRDNTNTMTDGVPAYSHSSFTDMLSRILRFKYELTDVDLASYAVFSLICIIKNRS